MTSQAIPAQPQSASRLPRAALALLIIAVCVCPRIPLPVALPGRTFDLRIEDLMLPVILLVSILVRPRFDPTPLGRPIALYMMVTLQATILALFSLELSPLRSALYWLKDLEFVLFFFLFANLIRTATDLSLCVRALMFAGALNAAWFGYQTVTSNYHSLFVIDWELPQDVYVGAARFESYGPHLIGEASPLSAGGVMMLIFLVAYSLFLFLSPGRKKLLAGAFAACLLGAVVLSLSRSSIIAAVAGAFAIMVQGRHQIRQKLMLLMTACFILGAGLLAQEAARSSVSLDASIIDRFSTAGVARGIDERLNHIWLPLLHEVLDRPLLGYGKSAPAYLPEFPADPHNYYLRVLVEAGAIGLAAFGWMLVSIARLCSAAAISRHSIFARVASSAAFGGTLGLSFAGLFEDAFLPVLLNEVWWIIVGISVAATRLEKSHR